MAQGGSMDGMEKRNEMSSGRSDRDERREFRRKRRIRSQIIAYSMAGALSIGVIAAVGYGVSQACVMIQAKTAAKDASLEEATVEAEQTAVSSPEETVVESEVESTEAMLDSIVDTCLSEMPIEDKVAGLFMVTPEELTGSDAVIKAGTATQDALSARAVGGLYYSSKNAKDEAQLADMLTATADMSKYPLFLATAEVGGEDSHIAKALSIDIPAAPAEIAATNDSQNALDSATRIAKYLNGCGFNLNMGISANLSENNNSYGTDSSKVSDMVSQTVTGLQSFGVSACLQFFPETTDSGMSADEMSDALAPFRAGIEAGANMIMVCSGTSSGISGDQTPACLSSAVIEDTLRQKLGFDGVIITDTLSDFSDMSSADAAVMAIQAGADMLNQPANFEEAYEGVLAAVQNGTISSERIDESLRRIYRIKYAERVEKISEGN